MTTTAPVHSQVICSPDRRKGTTVPDDHSATERTALPADALAGLSALSAQRLQRHSRLYLRTQESVRQLVDDVADETGAQIVEVIEYAILHTYGKDD